VYTRRIRGAKKQLQGATGAFELEIKWLFARYPPALLSSVALSARAYLDPVGAIPKAVESRAWVVPLLWLMVTVAASGAAFATRLDASSEVIPKMAEAGDLQKASEREVNEEVEQSERISLVAGVAKGVVGMPMIVLAIAIALKLVSWLMGRKVLFSACFTTAALAMLPVALFYLLNMVIALRQDVVIPAQADKLMVTNALGWLGAGEGGGPGKTRALAALDFFNLWSAGLLGLGFAAAAKLKPWQGLVLGLFLYTLFAAAILIGLPGLMGGGGPR
jgi:hypothetical protein